MLQNVTHVADKWSVERWVAAADQEMGMTTTTDAAAVNKNAASLVTPKPGQTFATSSVEQLPSGSDQINFTDNMWLQREIWKPLQQSLLEWILVTDEELMWDRAAAADITAMDIPARDLSSVLHAPGWDLSCILKM